MKHYVYLIPNTYYLHVRDIKRALPAEEKSDKKLSLPGGHEPLTSFGLMARAGVPTFFGGLP